MQVTRDGVHSNGGDLCITCVKDNDECVFKKALSNYHGGGNHDISMILTDCPEYSRVDFESPLTVTLNTNAFVRINTGSNE